MKLITKQTQTELKAGIYRLFLAKATMIDKKFIKIEFIVTKPGIDDSFAQTIEMYYDLSGNPWRFNKLAKACMFNLKTSRVAVMLKDKSKHQMVGKFVWALIRQVSVVDYLTGELVNTFQEPYEYYTFIANDKRPSVINDPDRCSANAEPFFIERFINDDTLQAVPLPQQL